MNNIFSTFKSNLLFVASISLLLITQSAHADFRKALDAYQKRDGATMLKEVKDAVDKKNHDGLILFLSMLELDSTLTNSRMFVFPNEREADGKLPASMTQGKSLPAPWQTMLSASQVDDFKMLLEKSTSQSSLESQYRLASLQLFSGYQASYSPRQSPEQAALLESLKVLGSKGYLNVFPYLADMENQKREPVKSPSYIKGLELGQTKLIMMQAADYLVGNKDKNITRNEKKGLQLLAQVLSKPDAEFYYADVANKISSYYLKKGTKQAQHQAYLWSLVALTNSRSGLVPQSLIALKKHGVLKKVAKNTDAAWDESFNKTIQRMNELGMDVAKFYGINRLPPELKDIKEFDLPELIAKNQKIDLQKQPVLSFHHFNYDKFYIIESAPIRNYLIDVYADGRVNFSLGPRLDRTQNTESFLKISPEAVKELIFKMNMAEFKATPLITNNKYAVNCGMASCDEIYDGVDSQNSIYHITIREDAKVRTVLFHNREGDDLQPFLAKTFKLLESQFNTQKYRCSTLETRTYYKHCIKQNNKIFEIANKEKLN